MGKIESAMRSEIVRLARKELRAMCGPLARGVRQLKRAASRLRKSIRPIEKAAIAYEQTHKPELRASEEEVKAARFSPRLIRSLRRRLGISQAQMGQLVDASIAAVGFWEAGRTRPSPAKRAALVALRKLGRRQVRRILEQKANARKRS